MRVLFILVFIFLAACTPNQTQVPIPANDPTPVSLTQTESSQAIDTQSASSGAPSELERTLYSIDAVFDFAAHTLSANQSIRYVNQSDSKINQLILRSFAHNYGADLQIDGLTRADGGQVESFEDGEGRWSVHLFDPLPPNHEVNLQFTFSLTLSNANVPLGWNARQTNFIDWYPFIPPFFHTGLYEYIDRAQALVGEYQVYESADFNVHLEVINAPATLTLAAPGIPLEEGGLDFSLENARRFAWSASSQYSKLESKQDSILVSIYFIEDHRDAAEAALEVAKQALGIYSDLFGPYPHQSLAIVEATFPDGLESDGLFFLDQFYFQTYSYDRQNYLTALTAHEVAHNWWFSAVGNDQAIEPWLDEALAIYSELLYYENAFPALVDWWWEFRITRFEPSGWMDSTIYEYAEFGPYVRAVYMRGALFLQEVRTVIGDEAFFSFLRGYAESGAGRIVTAEEFFAKLNEASAVDLTPIYENYFR